MATSTPSNSQQKTDSSEKIAQQFLSSADDYFRTEIKCMFSSFFLLFHICIVFPFFLIANASIREIDKYILEK